MVATSVNDGRRGCRTTQPLTLAAKLHHDWDTIPTRARRRAN